MSDTLKFKNTIMGWLLFILVLIFYGIARTRMG